MRSVSFHPSGDFVLAGLYTLYFSTPDSLGCHIANTNIAPVNLEEIV